MKKYILARFEGVPRTKNILCLEGNIIIENVREWVCSNDWFIQSWDGKVIRKIYIGDSEYKERYISLEEQERLTKE